MEIDPKFQGKLSRGLTLWKGPSRERQDIMMAVMTLAGQDTGILPLPQRPSWYSRNSRRFARGA